jgi:4-alpha-glucanotransferase
MAAELGCAVLAPDSRGATWDAVTGAFGPDVRFLERALAVAGWSVIPTQDVLSLGSSARMNRPSSAEGNWEWRATSEQLASDAFRRLGVETENSGRSK